MNEISSIVAFWIFSAWRQMDSQLHVKGTIGGQSADSAAVMRWSDPILAKISLGLGQNMGQKDEWKVSLKGAKFLFDVPESATKSEVGEGFWLAFISIELPDGSHLLLAERFLEPTFVEQ